MMRRLVGNFVGLWLVLGLMILGCAEEDDGFTGVGGGRRNPLPKSEPTVEATATPTAEPTAKSTPTPSPPPEEDEEEEATPRPRESTVHLESPGPEYSAPPDASGSIDDL